MGSDDTSDSRVPVQPDGDVGDHPLWPWAHQVQSTRGRELAETYGAHALDVAWVQLPDGRWEPGLVFSVGDVGDGGAGAAAVPVWVDVSAEDGRRRRIRTAVRIEPATLE